MKSLEELSWTSADLPSLLTQVILAEVEEAARTRRFGRNLIRINEDLVRTKGRSLVFYRRGTLSASSVSEATSMATSGQTISYTPHTLTVGKVGVAALISQEAIDGSNLDLIRDTVTEAGISLADKEDTDIVETLLGATKTHSTLAAGVFGATITAPVIFFSLDAHSGTINTCKVSTGTLGFTAALAQAGTLETWTTTRTNYKYSQTAATFSYEDIMTGANVIRSHKWEPDFMMINPAQMNHLLKNAQFVDFSKYGAREPLLRGEIGMISGMKVLVTTGIPEGNAIVIASKRAAWLAIKRPIDLKRWDNPQTDSIELYFYMEYGVSVTDEDAICLITGMEAKAI